MTALSPERLRQLASEITGNATGREEPRHPAGPAEESGEPEHVQKIQQATRRLEQAQERYRGMTRELLKEIELATRELEEPRRLCGNSRWRPGST